MASSEWKPRRKPWQAIFNISVGVILFWRSGWTCIDRNWFRYLFPPPTCQTPGNLQGIGLSWTNTGAIIDKRILYTYTQRSNLKSFIHICGVELEYLDVIKMSHSNFIYGILEAYFIDWYSMYKELPVGNNHYLNAKLAMCNSKVTLLLCCSFSLRDPSIWPRNYVCVYCKWRQIHLLLCLQAQGSEGR